MDSDHGSAHAAWIRAYEDFKYDEMVNPMLSDSISVKHSGASGPTSPDSLRAIRYLAEWAPSLRVANDDVEEDVKADCVVLVKLIDAARREGSQASAEFQQIVRRTAELFPLLGEPLEALDFSEHRWLGEHREEAYSDWLQWIIGQADPVEVLQVFGADDPEVIPSCRGCSVAVVRERYVSEGHEGSPGRLDLDIEFGDAALLVVEVKLSDAESADTKKGRGYRRSVEREYEDDRHKKYIILVLDASDEDYFGFKPRLWADSCIQLRLMAVRLCRQGQLLRAAMILAFVSAVERSLLKLEPLAGRSDDHVAAALSLPPVSDHLNRFLEAYEYNAKHHA